VECKEVLIFSRISPRLLQTGWVAGRSVKCTTMMFLLKDSAVSHRLAVVYAMMDGLERAQIREVGFEIVVRSSARKTTMA
jgi:hypothetical protein